MVEGTHSCPNFRDTSASSCCTTDAGKVRLGGYAPDVRRSEARLLRQLGRSSRTLLRSRIVMVGV